VQVVTAGTGINSVDVKSIDAACPPGKTALGGGASVSGPRVALALKESRPIVAGGRASGWNATAEEISASSNNWQLVVYAVCAAAS
jgi:hypothetical protein